jgi:hypothetical protein
LLFLAVELVGKKQRAFAVFYLWLGMLFFHHASKAMSRKAKRLDIASRRGMLAYALPALSAFSLGFSSPFPDEFFGLDIEGLFRSLPLLLF